MREARLTRSRARAAADDGRDRGTVVWCAERGRDDQRPPGKQQPSHRVDAGDLESIVRRERRQDAGQPAGEHRLARPRRARQQEVVISSGCDLECAPSTLLPADVLEIRMRNGRRAAVRRLKRRRFSLATQISSSLGKVPQRHRLDAGKRRLRRRAGGAEEPLEPAVARSFRSREHAAYGPHAPVQRQLADGSVPPQPLSRNLMRRREHRQGDRQVEAGAFLSQDRRREVHGDAMPRPLETRRGHAGANTVLRLLACAVREADDREAGQAAFDVRLHLHPPRVEADKSVGDRAREHTVERSRGLHACW